MRRPTNSLPRATTPYYRSGGVLPPDGHPQPPPSLIEEAFTALGGGSGIQRANAAAVHGAAKTIDASATGAQRGALGSAPHLDREKWKRLLEELPLSSRGALSIAAAASQHGVRSHATANPALANSVLAGHIAKHAQREAQKADLSALQNERATIALCKAQIAQLRLLVQSQAKPDAKMTTAFMALQTVVTSLGAPEGDWRFADEKAFAEAAKTTLAFGHRLTALSGALDERSTALEHRASSVSEPPITTLEQAAISSG